jgi:hypothetical protein
MPPNTLTARDTSRLAGPGLAIGGLITAAFFSVAAANADRAGDLDPFADAGLPNGATLDALLPAPLAAQLDNLGDTYPPFDPSNFAVSVDGMTLFQVGTAHASSGVADIAIADGADSNAVAGGADIPGRFDIAVADGAGTLAGAGWGNSDSAFANGDDSIADAAGGDEGNLSNGDLAVVEGSLSHAFAGFDGASNDAPSSNDVALVLDPVGSVGSTAEATDGISDYAAVAADNGDAVAGLGNFDIAQVFADGLTASAVDGSFLTNVVP